MRGKGKGRGAWPSPLPQAVIVALLCNQKSVARKTFLNSVQCGCVPVREFPHADKFFFHLLDVSTSRTRSNLKSRFKVKNKIKRIF